MFRAPSSLFLVGSILCGQSPNLPFLIAARFFQGIGGAMMMPVGRLVLMRSVEKEDLIQAMSWLLIPALVGPILGPPLGGFIVTYLDWRWIFYLNVPIGVAGRGAGQPVHRPGARRAAAKRPTSSASCSPACRSAACCSASR